MTRAIALAFCAFVTGLLPAAGLLRADPVHAARSAAAPRCSNIQLLIQAYRSQGAAGSGAVIYRLHNMAGQACSLQGYPGVQLLDRNFQSLPTSTHRGGRYLVGAIPIRPITVPAFGNAYFALGFSDVPVNGQCEAAAHYIIVIPPNDYLPDVTYAFPNGGSFTACTGNVAITPATATPRYR